MPFAILPKQKLPASEPGVERATFPFITGLSAQAASRDSERELEPTAVPSAASGSRRVAGLRSPAPRRAPLRPRARSSRPAHSPAGSRRALPRPPAAGGGGGARPASRARRVHPGVRARGSRPPPPQAGGGGAAGPAAPRGGAPRAALGAGLEAVPTLTAVHCGGASEDGHELRRRSSTSARVGSPPPPPGCCPSPLASLRRSWSAQSPRSAQPRPTPVPARTAPPPAARTSWSWLVLQSTARTRFFRAAPLRRPPPRPPRGWPEPLPHPRPALTCSLAQPQTLAVGSPRSLYAGRGRDGRGARGHGSGSVFWIFFFFF